MLIKKKKKRLRLSYSAIEKFLRCDRLYYLQYVLGLRKPEINEVMIFGRVAQVGISWLYAVKPKVAVKYMKAAFAKEISECQRQGLILSQDMERFNRLEVMMEGMIYGYARYYSITISKLKRVKEEAEVVYLGIKGVRIIMYLDNLFEDQRKRLLLHELKTKGDIQHNSVMQAKTNLQTAIYVYLPNQIKGQRKIKEVLFDMIKRPGIRQKKATKNKPEETKQEYVSRLRTWYDDNVSEHAFFMEPTRVKDLTISEENLMNTLEQVSSQIKRYGKDQDAFKQDFMRCWDGYQCPMYSICHSKEGGLDNPTVMVEYTTREQRAAQGIVNQRIAAKKKGKK